MDNGLELLSIACFLHFNAIIIVHGLELSDWTTLLQRLWRLIPLGTSSPHGDGVNCGLVGCCEGGKWSCWMRGVITVKKEQRIDSVRCLDRCFDEGARIDALMKCSAMPREAMLRIADSEKNL